MNIKVKFEPKTIIIDGAIIVTDENGETIYEKNQTFAYKYNEFGELMELLP